MVLIDPKAVISEYDGKTQEHIARMSIYRCELCTTYTTHPSQELNWRPNVFDSAKNSHSGGFHWKTNAADIATLSGDAPSWGGAR